MGGSAEKTYAALRFTEDANLNERLYWYLAEFPVKENDEVLAPVGPHDRLQKARVERVLSAEDGAAPYDPVLIKKIAAAYGARVFAVGETPCYEFGGQRYDGRHYTRYGVLLYAKTAPDPALLREYGVAKTFLCPRMGEDIFTDLLRGRCVLLAGGEGAKICKSLLSLLKGEEEAAAYYSGLLGDLLEKIKNRLG